MVYSLKFNCLSIPYQDEYGETPLNTACGHGHGDVASLLITKGALVNFQTKVRYDKQFHSLSPCSPI